MVVNSLPFWYFFIALLIPYWLASKCKTSKWQNILLLVASYYFYACASWKMCFLLAAATLIFYGLGIAIERFNTSNSKAASRLTSLGVCLGVGLLVYYKFLDFFVVEFGELLTSIGLQNNIRSFGIIMPLGISFFTFKLISYVIEVHRGNMAASKNIVDFGVFISFFPTILSGPIDRPKEFISQLPEKRKPLYDNLMGGAKNIIWGLFLKMCIADRIASYTDSVFCDYASHSGTTLLLAMFFYAIQMYTDFCGYTEMAIGVSKILGIKIRPNFNRPFLAQNVAEYWRRWHMSLTTWLTDYLFMPLCVVFRDWGKFGLYLATVINLVVVGFWHGANWTYGLFGLYHGLLIVAVTAAEKRRKKLEKKYKLKDKWGYRLPRIMLTFFFVSFGLLIFQAPSVNVFFKETFRIITEQDITNIYRGQSFREFAWTLVFIFIFLSKEFVQEFLPSVCKLYDKQYIRWACFYLICTIILLFGFISEGKFIYVQF